MSIIRRKFEEALRKDRELNFTNSENTEIETMVSIKNCNILRKKINIMKNYAVNIIDKSYKTNISGKPQIKK